MARAYFKLRSSIWDDEDFLALNSGAQRLYFLLGSQKDISMCGVMGLAVKRWAKFGPDTSPSLVMQQLKELVEARFVVIDEIAEEVWIRTFIKHDEASLGTPNVFVSLTNAYYEIHSRTIRQRFLEGLTEGLLQTMWQALEDPSTDGNGKTKRERMHQRFVEDFIRVHARADACVTQPITINHQPSNNNLPVLAENGSAPVPAKDSEFDHCWKVYPRREGRKAAERAYRARRNAGVSADDLLAATRHYAKAMAQTELRFIKQGSTFYGPDDHWQDYVNPNSAVTRRARAMTAREKAVAAAKEAGR